MNVEPKFCWKSGQSSEQAMEPVLFLLRGADFHDPVNRLDGYDADAAGDIVPIDTLLAPGQSIHRLSASAFILGNVLCPPLKSTCFPVSAITTVISCMIPSQD